MSFKYIFLLSMPRSGSTLFRLLLSNIDGVVSLPETFFFVFLKENKDINFNTNKGKEQLINSWVSYYTTRRNIDDLEKLKHTLYEEVKHVKDIFEITVLQYIKENKIEHVNYVVEKSPPHIFFQKEIKQLFPESRAIYLLRDPRAVAGSMLNKPWATHNIYTIARSWSKSTKLFGFIKDSIVVRYEDLVNKDDGTYQSITKFFNASNVNIDDFYNNTEQNTKGVRKDYHTNLSKPVDSNHIDKWKVQLSKVDKEREIIEHVCYSQMHKYDYSRTTSEKTIGFWLIYFIDAVKFLLIKVLS